MATSTVGRTVDVGETTAATVLRRGAALATLGAAALHLHAAVGHREHAAVLAFFLVAAAAQIALAGQLAPARPPRLVAPGTTLVNGGLVVTWVLSRTVGLGFVPGVDGREAVGWSDLAATGLESAAVLALTAAAAVSLAGDRVMGARTARAAPVGTAVAVAALSAWAAVVSPYDGHGHGTEEEPARLASAVAAGADGHGHGDGEPEATSRAGARSTGGSSATGTGTDDGHGHGQASPAAGSTAAGQRLGLVGVHDHTGADLPTAADGGQLTHLHAAVVPGRASGEEASPGRPADAAPDPAVTGPAPPDPLEGPGTISTMRIGPIPLLPSVPGIELPHLSPALPFAGPGRLNLLPLAGLPPPCRDCFVLGIKPDLVYADGTAANLDTGPMLHHAVFADPARTDPVCGRNTLIGQLGHRLFAVGNERTSGSLPPGFGVPLGSGPWAGVVELMNASTEARTVFLEATVRWVPRSTPGIQAVTPVWLDVDSCGDSEVAVGAGPTDVDWEWASSLTGRIVAAGGHLHDGGRWLGLRNATTGDHVCTSVAGYGRDPAYAGTLETMSYCAWDRLAPVHAGDRLHLRAHYDAASPQPGVMGIMLVFVAETADVAAGSPSPYPAEPPPGGGPIDTGHSH